MDNDRTFRDSNGIEWRVIEVSPTSDVADGWLSFESGLMERRLFPFPTNWHHSTIQRLEQMCRIATPIQRDQTAIASHAMSVSPDVTGSADLGEEGSNDERLSASAPASDHVSFLANKWPTREPRVSFRG